MNARTHQHSLNPFAWLRPSQSEHLRAQNTRTQAELHAARLRVIALEQQLLGIHLQQAYWREQLQKGATA